MSSQFASDAPELPDELVTFLMPITNKYLLLPNVTIAEIIHHRVPKQPDDMPTWFLGLLDWRGQKVPMISFEALNDEPFVADNRRQNIAVLNGISNTEKLPFMAMLTQGAPRLLRLNADEVATIEGGETTGPAELMLVSANGEQAVIPNLDTIEKGIIELLQL